MTETLEKKGLDAHLDAALQNYDEDLNPIAERPISEPAAPEKAAPTTPSDDEPDGAAVDESGRAHGADGRFVAKAPAKAKHSAPEQGTAEAKSAEPPLTDTPPVEQVEPHAMWSPELKGQFAKWAPDVQKAFRESYLATQATFTRNSQEVAEIRKAIEPTFAEVQRHQPFLTAIGYTPDRFIRESVAVAQNLMNGNPQNQGQGIAYLMQMYRIPAEAVLQALGISFNPGEAPKADPALQQLHSSHLEMSQQLQQLRNEQRTWKYQTALAQFEEIGAQRDANGQPRFPYWEQVRATMIDLVANGRSDSWENAYEKAVRMDDELFKANQETQRKSWVEAEAARRQEAVQKARRAQPVHTTPSAPGGGQTLKGLDAHLAAAIAKHMPD